MIVHSIPTFDGTDLVSTSATSTIYHKSVSEAKVSTCATSPIYHKSVSEATSEYDVNEYYEDLSADVIRTNQTNPHYEHAKNARKVASEAAEEAAIAMNAALYAEEVAAEARERAKAATSASKRRESIFNLIEESFRLSDDSWKDAALAVQLAKENTHEVAKDAAEQASMALQAAYYAHEAAKKAILKAERASCFMIKSMSPKERQRFLENGLNIHDQISSECPSESEDYV
jgi:hypothetical protein